MTFQRILFLGAIASCALLAAGADARAGYSWTTSPVSPTAAPAGVTDTFTSISGTSPVDSLVSESFVTVSYTPTSASPVSGTQTLAWTETLTSTTTVQTEEFAIFGPLTIYSASTGGVAANFAATIIPVLGSGFGLIPTGYSSISSLGKAANLGFIITPPTAPTIVPAPASMAILGTGLVGVIGFALRRRRATNA